MRIPDDPRYWLEPVIAAAIDTLHDVHSGFKGGGGAVLHDCDCFNDHHPCSHPSFSHRPRSIEQVTYYPKELSNALFTGRMRGRVYLMNSMLFTVIVQVFERWTRRIVPNSTKQELFFD